MARAFADRLGLGLGLTLLLASCGAAADDAPTAPAVPAPAAAPAPAAVTDAKQRAERARAALLEPAAADEFTFEADVLQADLLFGHARYAWKAVGTGAAARWEAGERSEIAAEAGSVTQDTKAVLERDLRFVTYERTEAKGMAPAKATSVVWISPGHLQITTRSGTDEASATSRDGDPAALATVASLLILLGRLPAEPATYELPIFAASTGATQPAVLEIVGPARLEVASASFDTTLARANIAGVAFEFHLGRVDRRPLAIRMPDRDVTILQKGLVEARAPAPIDVSTPAATGAEAAARFVFGFLTRDAAVIGRSIDAASVRKGLAKDGYEGDEAGVPARLLQGLSGDGAPAKRQAELSARSAVARATSTTAGDVVEWTLGRPVAGLVLATKSINGAWLVVGVDARH